MSIDNNKIVTALSTILNPKTGLNIIRSKMVDGLKIDGNNVTFTLKVPPSDAAIKSELNFACMAAIQEVYPEAQVHVHMAGSEAGGKADNLPQIKNIIAVGSGKGGVGKSTVAVNLALALKKMGAKVGLMDADLYGPSVPTLLGMQGERPKLEKLYGQAKMRPLEKYGIYTISIGFIIEPEQAVVLRGPRLGGIIKQFINDCLWPELDFLIIDLPPGTGDIQLTMVQTVPVTGAVMVTTPQELAYVDALKAMNMFQLSNVNVPIIGVVENMSWFTPEELPNNKYYIFGKGAGKRLVKESKTTLLGQIPLIQSVREAGDGGEPAVLNPDHPAYPYFMSMAERTLEQVNLRNEAMAPTQIVKINT
ncbi:Mrp/NBP35 family ATP-binding protein [Portibacter lacus]|uniref:Iron-sulfur cluster carrier protein n=1 Tax=Portibacter lacus TaxID=1099794 RepID=A0AA37SPA8_9BACT|nr:Mrp/NBP35 family ATP-binding protein [Portibacter lacus]GLR18338.1 iron-sulfur cluster carrier protein [Portibacter lacus]